MHDKLGRELNIGDTVVYAQTNHSVTPMIGVVEAFNEETRTISVKTETNRKVARYGRELILLVEKSVAPTFPAVQTITESYTKGE